MKHLAIVITIAFTALNAAPAVTLISVEREGAKYWPRWRGPSGQGTSRARTTVDTWSETTDVKWRVGGPGRRHSPPIVWRNHIFLTTDEDRGGKLSMLAFDRTNWRTDRELSSSPVDRAVWPGFRAEPESIVRKERARAETNKPIRCRTRLVA